MARTQQASRSHETDGIVATAWRSIRKAAGLKEVRFHDGRHTAITTLAEKGLPDWVIQAQVGHVAPEMMKTYSHIRRQALNQAADAIEPNAPASSSPPPTKAAAATVRTRAKRVMSHGTSQNAGGRGRVVKFDRKVGSPHWTISATTSSVQRDGTPSPPAHESRIRPLASAELADAPA